ncbi:MAG: hypothetical protein HY321_18155 [Armatimonadetes bacterium]|nr:hypothetical protein [Armatimonadota bacterium]
MADGSVGAGSRTVVDPVLYAGIILRMKRGDRSAAVRKVCEELQIGQAEAEAAVDRLWLRYQSEIPPDVAHQRANRLPWMRFALTGAALGVPAAWMLLRLLG